LKIINKVLIKQIITEKSKEKLKSRFNREKMQLEQESQQLLFEQRKLQHKQSGSKEEIARRFQLEIKRRKDEQSLLDFKLEQLDILEIGHEMVEQVVEALVEVQEGAHWNKLMNEKAIIIKDDIVIRIDR